MKNNQVYYCHQIWHIIDLTVCDRRDLCKKKKHKSQQPSSQYWHWFDDNKGWWWYITRNLKFVAHTYNYVCYLLKSFKLHLGLAIIYQQEMIQQETLNKIYKIRYIKITFLGRMCNILLWQLSVEDEFNVSAEHKSLMDILLEVPTHRYNLFFGVCKFQENQ